ncbi:hypothetical protein ROP_53670 [Rhodococcus opacus B4]|uniref:Uncharacterized protein n=1 Tax=Rhodococcus opacus (strain B4) TaxID=632772 RepID=C1AVC4_RHOOB|nr:hypothetical protein ROP_53670 [Rhodococcus opacus B4]
MTRPRILSPGGEPGAEGYGRVGASFYLAPQVDEFLRAEVAAHVRKQVPFLLGDMRADLQHQGGKFGVEPWFPRHQPFEAFHRFLRLGVFIPRLLRLGLADLALDGRVHLGFFGNRVLDPLNRDLFQQVLAAGPVIGTGQAFELAEHPFHLAMVLGQDIDDITLLIRHNILIFFLCLEQGSEPAPVVPSQWSTRDRFLVPSSPVV